MGFKTYQISELIDEIAMGPFGSNIKVDCFVESGIPVLNGSNLAGLKIQENEFRYVTLEKANSLKKANAYRGDIVITHRGTLGQISYIPTNSKYERYVISQSQFRIRCNDKIIPEYMVYYFSTKLGQHKLLSNASQVGVPALARPSTTFQLIEIDIPPLETQKQIAKILSSIDDKIELNNKINDNLEKQAQAIFKSWFVDFEPFGGVMPRDWNVGTIGDVIELHDAKRVPLAGAVRDKMTNKLYPYYGAASLMDYVDNYIFDGTYLLLGEDGTVVDSQGYPILQYVWGKFWVNNHAHILTGKNGFTVESLYLLFNQTPVKSVVTGAVQPKISQANLKSIEIMIPELGVMNKFNNLVEPFFLKIKSNKEEIDRLSQLRDTLLPRLMSGEIDVSQVEI